SFVERLSLLVDQQWSEGFAMGPEPREPFRSRADRRGEKLHRLCPRPEGVPRWVLRILHAGGGTVPRSGPGTRRWKLSQSARTIEPHGCAGDRRLGHGAAVRTGASRLPGNLRGPVSGTLADSHFAAVCGALARTDRRSDRSRWHLRPAGS